MNPDLTVKLSRMETSWKAMRKTWRLGGSESVNQEMKVLCLVGVLDNG